MTCAESRDLIEAVAAGDVAPDAAFETHVAGCRACAAALQMARRIEQALAAAPLVMAPVRFSRDVLARIRRDRWRHEERVDRAFNVMVAAGIALIVAAAVSLLNLTSVARMLLSATDAVARIQSQPAPWTTVGALPTFTITACVIVTAAAVWAWAERRADYADSQ